MEGWLGCDASHGIDTHSTTHNTTRNPGVTWRALQTISAIATEPAAWLDRHDRVILIVVGIVIAIAAARTPWRMLSTVERVWAVLALCDAILTFAIPSVSATSSWRQVSDRAMLTCAGGCLLLICAGIPLVRARSAAHQSVRPLVPAFGVLAVPAFGIVLVSLLWGAARG
jgi:hypothetical protein